MHFIFKFIIVLLTLAGVLTLFAFIGSQLPTDETRPQETLSYEDVIPRGFAAQGAERVLDPRDAGLLMHPTPQIAEVAARIRSVCLTDNEECAVRAISTWLRTHIEHVEVVQVRPHLHSPAETLLFRQADDLALSVLFVSLVRSQGISARVGMTPYSTFVEFELDEPMRIDFGCANCGLNSIRFRGTDDRVTWIE